MRRTREIVAPATIVYFKLDTATGKYIQDKDGLLAGIIWGKDSYEYSIVVHNMDLTMMKNEYVQFIYSIFVYAAGNEWIQPSWNESKVATLQYNNNVYVSRTGDEVPKEEAVNPDTGELNEGYYRQLDFIVGVCFKGDIEYLDPFLYDFILTDISHIEGLEISDK